MTTSERKYKTLAKMAAEASDTKDVACPRCGGGKTREVSGGVLLCSKCGREFTVAK